MRKYGVVAAAAACGNNVAALQPSSNVTPDDASNQSLARSLRTSVRPCSYENMRNTYFPLSHNNSSSVVSADIFRALSRRQDSTAAVR